MNWSFDPKSILPARSAFTSALWLCALITFPAVAGAVVAPFWISVWLLGLATAIDIGTFIIFIVHSVRNQHLLQSEDYLIKLKALTLYGENIDAGPNIARIALEDKSELRHATGRLRDE